MSKEKTITSGEVWFAKFPLEENPTQFIPRPVIVLDAYILEVLSVKVTKIPPRPEDEFDTPIIFWEEANLRCKSTARVSKTIILDKVYFDFKIGTLHPDDFETIQRQFMRFVSQQE